MRSFFFLRSGETNHTILGEFNSAMMVTRYDDIMAHNRLNTSFKWRNIRDNSLMSVICRCPVFTESRLTGSTVPLKA